MRISRHWKWITLMVLCLALPLQAADDQPRYDVKKIEIFSEITTADNKIDALADLHLTLLDKTNFIILRLNGNLTVASISDETGEHASDMLAPSIGNPKARQPAADFYASSHPTSRRTRPPGEKAGDCPDLPAAKMELSPSQIGNVSFGRP